MAEAVYILCTVASLACAGLLARAYRKAPSRLLFWSAWCFGGLALNAALVAVDLMFLPEYDLRALRAAASLVGLLGLLWSLVRDDAAGGPR